MKSFNCFIIFSLLLISACTVKQKNNKDVIFVSIAPQKYFVEKIAVDFFDVKLMVKPGYNPATYEPLPQQLVQLSKSKIFFSIGVPFEKSWLGKIKTANPKMRIIDTRKGIKLRNMDDSRLISEKFVNSDNFNEKQSKHHIEKDPHIWLSPALVKIQAQTILQTLLEIEPDNRDFFQTNFNEFINELSELQENIKNDLKDTSNKPFLVFHPSWGYFADEFDLIQIPIEIEGKEPSPQEMATIIDFAKNENIKTIFVQEQFSSKEAETIAQALKGKVIKIDPLAENYLENMHKISKIFANELK